MRDPGEENQTQSQVLSELAVQAVLGMGRQVPLTPPAMAAGLRITFYPGVSTTERVQRFVGKLRHALAAAGATILGYQEALREPSSGKLQENLVTIAAGEMQTGNLAVDHITNLRTSTLVGVVDGPCPTDSEEGLQDKLNSVVRALAWHVVQVVIFVDDRVWTVCTMNGAIVRFNSDDDFVGQVASVLIPKLAAPVVPPHASDFDLREGQLDLTANGAAEYARDFTKSGTLWARTGLMLFHTSMDSLEFRSRYYQRIVAAFLDHRSGMSYGFLARQLPVPLEPAMTIGEANERLGQGDWEGPGFRRLADRLYVTLHVKGGPLIAAVPDVWVLTTRSGCDKSNVDVDRDVVLLGLSNGRIIFETPSGVSARVDCKPSYDTLTILSHAVANAIIGSALRRLRPDSRFSRMLHSQGAALAHWHGMVSPSVLPLGYFFYGQSNPPVSCSTHQSGIYALTGKMSALQQSLEEDVEFVGDVHVEPYHGINITGASLEELAGWVLDVLNADGVTRFSEQNAELPPRVES
jgi:hypothetical protein